MADSNITILLEKILSAVYGEEVRQSIHDAIKQIYIDAAKEGNANLELIQARGLSETLNDRLNSYDLLLPLIESFVELAGVKEETVTFKDRAERNTYTFTATFRKVFNIVFVRISATLSANSTAEFNGTLNTIPEVFRPTESVKIGENIYTTSSTTNWAFNGSLTNTSASETEVYANGCYIIKES